MVNTSTGQDDRLGKELAFSFLIFALLAGALFSVTSLGYPAVMLISAAVPVAGVVGLRISENSDKIQKDFSKLLELATNKFKEVTQQIDRRSERDVEMGASNDFESSSFLSESESRGASVVSSSPLTQRSQSVTKDFYEGNVQQAMVNKVMKNQNVKDKLSDFAQSNRQSTVIPSKYNGHDVELRVSKKGDNYQFTNNHGGNNSSYSILKADLMTKLNLSPEQKGMGV